MGGVSSAAFAEITTGALMKGTLGMADRFRGELNELMAIEEGLREALLEEVRGEAASWLLGAEEGAGGRRKGKKAKGQKSKDKRKGSKKRGPQEARRREEQHGQL